LAVCSAQRALASRNVAAFLARHIDPREFFSVFPTLTSEDFRRPKEKRTNGDDRKDKIHLAVGRAIHHWEVVEHHLGGLFQSLLGTSVPMGAMRAYGAMTGFAMRQQMLLHASSVMFHFHENKTLRSEFNTLIKNVMDNASQRRNDFGHGLVIKEYRGRGGSYYLVPSYYSKHRSIDAEPDYIYTSKEIGEFVKKFKLLAGMVHRLHMKILTWRDTWPQKPRQPPRPPPQ
jgi:hypothetical protein